MTSNNITPFQQMISSCTGAVITSLFVTPLDVVKVRLQAQQKMVTSKCFTYCNLVVEDLCCCVNGVLRNGPATGFQTPRPLTGTTDAFFRIARSEGVRTLWSGLPPTMLMSVPGTVIYFTVYDQLKALCGKHLGLESTVAGPMLAGASARVISVTCISPLEMVRTAMQSKKLSYLEIGQALRDQVQTKGIGSMWRGLVPTIWRDVPFSSIYWCTYENLKNYFGQQQPTFCFSLFAGATSGGVSALVTTPFDVVKTHRQIELSEKMAKGQHAVSPSMLNQMRILYQTQGPKSLFAGLVPRLVKIMPACAIMISTYEFGKKFFQQHNKAAVSK